MLFSAVACLGLINSAMQRPVVRFLVQAAACFALQEVRSKRHIIPSPPRGGCASSAWLLRALVLQTVPCSSDVHELPSNEGGLISVAPGEVFAVTI